MFLSRHWVRSLVSLAAVVLLALGVEAVRALQPPAIDSERLLANLVALASDDMEGRLTGSPGGRRARQFLVDRFREANLEPVEGTFEHPFGNGSGASVPARGVNIIGRVTGTQSPDRYLIVGAHYDHVGVRSGQIYNGANDNASGAAALPVIAAHFVRLRPRVSMLFVAFDAEEQNLAGSRAFVRQPPVPREAILANVNLDMIGRDASATLWAVGARRFPAFRPIIERVAAAAPVTLRLGHDTPGGPTGEDWTRDSDHYAFIEAGIPALYLGVEDYRYLHKPDDDTESMMLDFYVNAVRTIVQVVAEIDRHAESIGNREVPVR